MRQVQRAKRTGSSAGLGIMAKEMEMAMDGTSDGRKAHVDWESVRGNENECDAESRIRHSGGVRSRAWWDAWFERSDEWRDEVGHEA